MYNNNIIIKIDKEIETKKKLKSKIVEIETNRVIDNEYLLFKSNNFKNITKLKFCFYNSDLDLNRQAYQLLSRCFEYYFHLKELWISYINGDCMKLLAQNLYFIPNLKKLILRESKIEDKGMTYLCNHLDYISKLEELSVDSI